MKPKKMERIGSYLNGKLSKQTRTAHPGSVYDSKGKKIGVLKKDMSISSKLLLAPGTALYQ